jgi:SNF2 family DNA or RNA helicase
MLAFDMGTGKSRVVIEYINEMAPESVLICCPKSVMNVWPTEFAKYNTLGNLNIILKTKGTVKKRLESVRQAWDKQSVNVLIVNYDSVWRDPMGDALMGIMWDLVVADESHRIKAPASKVSWWMGRIRKKAFNRVCLTGTPFPHSPLDAYGQYRFLNPSTFGNSFVAFKSQYAILGGTPIIDRRGKSRLVQVVGFKNLENLHEKFYSIAIKVNKHDVLELPEAVHEKRVVALSPLSRRVYNELMENLEAHVEAGTVDVPNAMVLVMRLQQITSGFTKIGDVESDLGDEKRQLLADTLDDCKPHDPIVVFGKFRHDLDTTHKVATDAKRPCMELSGRKNELEEWQKYRKPVDEFSEVRAPVLAVQIRAGGVGIDLTNASTAIYFSQTFSLGDYEQSLARLHRPGQVNKVTYIHLIVEDSIDEKIKTALGKRAEVIEFILETLKRNTSSGNNNQSFGC